MREKRRYLLEGSNPLDKRGCFLADPFLLNSAFYRNRHHWQLRALLLDNVFRFLYIQLTPKRAMIILSFEKKRYSENLGTGRGIEPAQGEGTGGTDVWSGEDFFPLRGHQDSRPRIYPRSREDRIPGGKHRELSENQLVKKFHLEV